MIHSCLHLVFFDVVLDVGSNLARENEKYQDVVRLTPELEAGVPMTGRNRFSGLWGLNSISNVSCPPTIIALSSLTCVLLLTRFLCLQWSSEVFAMLPVALLVVFPRKIPRLDESERAN